MSGISIGQFKPIELTESLVNKEELTKRLGSLIETLKSNNHSARDTAALTLSKSSQMLGLLIEQAINNETRTRIKAIWTLGELSSFDKKLLDSSPIEDLLIKLLKEDPDLIVRSYSAEALGKFDSRDAVDSLIQALYLKDPTLSRFALQALGRIKDPKSIPYIARCLESNDPELSITTTEEDRHEVAYYAASALANIKHPDIVGPLFDFFQSNKDPVIRQYAFEALIQIGFIRKVN